MMKTFSIFLLLGISRGADIHGPWQIELTKPPSEAPNSCQPWAEAIQDGYNQIAEIVEAAVRDLNIIKGPRPDQRTDDSSRLHYENWDRIDRLLFTLFGFAMEPRDPNSDGFMKSILEVYEPMLKTLQGSENHPRYEKQLNKPAIACGDDEWKYYAPGDIDPNDPKRRPLREVPERQIFKDTGAWIWDNRYLWLKEEGSTSPKDRSTRQKVALCRGGLAVTTPEADLITLCPSLLDEESFKGTIDKAAIRQLISIEDIIEDVLANTLLHEFAHFYGATGDPSDPNWPVISKGDRKVADQQAVNRNGMLLYADKQDPHMSTTDPGPKENPNQKSLTYHWIYTQFLARPHPDNANSGPKKCVDTAESYTLFAIATWLSDWDWTDSPSRAKKWLGSP